ncbi:hypothetical protein U9M48_039931 [Paspalum notatum var. saurae]|uniref:Uncharacterized protein n=1 Tax=Paspalum notatum var. saurae TaxID=547442 RepID=A0AAQ3XDM3_PASNO
MRKCRDFCLLTVKSVTIYVSGLVIDPRPRKNFSTCVTLRSYGSNYIPAQTEMAGNNVLWQPQEVEDLLLYFKENIQVSGKSLVLREKYGTHFTGKQVYYKYHKLKGEWKVILKAKSASGASFDDVQKKIIYDEIENGDKRAKYYNVPIPFYDDMEFVFGGKHATGEFSVLQTPFDHPSKLDEADSIGNRRATEEQVNGDIDPSQHYDSDTVPGSESPAAPAGPKHKSEEKEKRVNDQKEIIQWFKKSPVQ